MDTKSNAEILGGLVWYTSKDVIYNISADVSILNKNFDSESTLEEFITSFSVKDQQAIDQLFKEIKKVPSKAFQHEALCDGNEKVTLHISPVFEGDKRFITIIEHSNDQSSEVYQEMIEHSRDLLSLHYPDGRFYFLSPSIREILGYEPEELIGVNPYQTMFHAKDLARIEKESHQKALEGELENHTEYRILHKDGYYIWFESYSKPVYNEAGEVVKLVVSSRDISEKKSLAKLLDETGKLASVGGWQYFPQSDKLDWTPETYRIHEIPLDTEVDLETAINYYHPAYRSLIRDKVNALIQEGTPYDIEAKIITAQQNEKWVRTKGQAEMVNDVPKKILGSFQDITDLKLTEEQLKANEKRTQQLTEHALDVIFWTDIHGFFTYLNPTALKLTNYEENELIGQHFGKVLAEEDLPYAAEYFEDLINKNIDNFYLRLRVVSKEGYWYWLGVYTQSIYNEGDIQEVVGIARDITEQVEAEEALKATTSRLYALIGNLQSGVLMENANRELILANQYFTELFQIPYSPSEMEGLDCVTLLQNAKGAFKDPDNFEAQVSEIVSKREYRIGEEWELKDDRTLERDHIPVFQGEHFLGHLWHYKDITERKETEQELIEAKERAEKASRAQADFLSTMSHEIRTPLNAVIGLSDILLQQNPKEEQVENLKVLKFSGENLLSLINDILDFNKIEAGKIEINEEPFNLNELITDLQKTHIFKAEEKGLELKYQADSNIPDHLIGDKTRIAQILNNLISNALKFTQEGSVTIETKKVQETESHVTVYFAVVDTGAGIPDDKLNTVFNSFTQAQASTQSQYGGTGLGLSITKRLLNLMNSEIKARSIVNEGTRFEFSITLQKVEGQSPEESSYGTSTSNAAAKLSGKDVLLVEDNQMNVFMARQILENWGITVTVGYNGWEAVDYVKNNNFDIILMDLQMPEMNGYEATRKIRQIEGAEYIPIIALTASAMMEVQDQVYTAGMNEYVTKPFKPEELYQKISELLN